MSTPTRNVGQVHPAYFSQARVYVQSPDKRKVYCIAASQHQINEVDMRQQFKKPYVFELRRNRLVALAVAGKKLWALNSASLLVVFSLNTHKGLVKRQLTALNQNGSLPLPEQFVSLAVSRDLVAAASTMRSPAAVLNRVYLFDKWLRPLDMVCLTLDIDLVCSFI